MNLHAAVEGADPSSAPPVVPAAASPLVLRLVRDFGAAWVDEAAVAGWVGGAGDRVLLLAGDAVRFPEGQDVAAVLPELMKAFPGRFQVAVVPRAAEDAVARRYGAQRWPTLLFFRDGQYVTAIPGMQDWQVYLERVAEALSMPASRAPIGIPVVAEGGGSPSCR
jgi:hydrogenase-1 operon protein HyaE